MLDLGIQKKVGKEAFQHGKGLCANLEPNDEFVEVAILA